MERDYSVRYIFYQAPVPIANAMLKDVAKSITTIRLERLRQLLKGKKQIDLAREIKKSAAQINQWTTGYRTISEGVAREIEAEKGLPTGWMDTDPELDSPASDEAVSKASYAFSTLANALRVLTGVRRSMAIAAFEHFIANLGDADSVAAQFERLIEEEKAATGRVFVPPDRQIQKNQQTGDEGQAQAASAGNEEAA